MEKASGDSGFINENCDMPCSKLLDKEENSSGSEEFENLFKTLEVLADSENSEVKEGNGIDIVHASVTYGSDDDKAAEVEIVDDDDEKVAEVVIGTDDHFLRDLNKAEEELLANASLNSPHNFLEDNCKEIEVEDISIIQEISNVSIIGEVNELQDCVILGENNIVTPDILSENVQPEKIVGLFVEKDNSRLQNGLVNGNHEKNVADEAEINCETQEITECAEKSLPQTEMLVETVQTVPICKAVSDEEIEEKSCYLTLMGDFASLDRKSKKKGRPKSCNALDDKKKETDRKSKDQDTDTLKEDTEARKRYYSEWEKDYYEGAQEIQVGKFDKKKETDRKSKDQDTDMLKEDTEARKRYYSEWEKDEGAREIQVRKFVPSRRNSIGSSVCGPYSKERNCQVCSCTILNMDWNSHINGILHQQKLKIFQSVNSSKEKRQRKNSTGDETYKIDKPRAIHHKKNCKKRQLFHTQSYSPVDFRPVSTDEEDFYERNYPKRKRYSFPTSSYDRYSGSSTPRRQPSRRYRISPSPSESTSSHEKSLQKLRFEALRSAANELPPLVLAQLALNKLGSMELKKEDIKTWESIARKIKSHVDYSKTKRSFHDGLMY